MFKSLSPGAIGVKATLSEGLTLAGAAGFQGLDVNIREVARCVREKGADHVTGLFCDAGLKIGAWGLPVSWNGPLEDYERDLRALPGMAAAAASVGAFRVSQWIAPASDERPFREQFRWCLGRLRPICNVLKDHGCSLGLEFIGPRTLRLDRRYGFIYSIAGMLGFCEALGTGNTGLLLDCWHWYTSLGTLADIRGLAPHDVIHVHVNDAPAGVDVEEQIDHVRALPSETGVIDLAGFLSALNEIGYAGPVTPEPFSGTVRELPAGEAVRVTHRGLDEAWRTAGLNSRD
ncbi:MAG: sugar phosphate isomerase/epimerase [Candidatus Latescibacteria bacterium]|nr:sugar phosphate isomerase/epimerase [Candidatus Latescibacterota bacterium]